MDSKAEAELILVYNADSDFLNIIKDSLYKAISPSTYNATCAPSRVQRVKSHR